MKFYRQKGPMDCGWAVVSMLCGYRVHNSDGLSVNQMSAKLNELTSTLWTIHNTPPDDDPERPIPINDLSYTDDTIVLLITPEDTPFIPTEPFIAHWIIKDKNTFYDPEMPVPLDIGEYPKQHWHYLRWISR
tara:strand:+ start:438 stop:833 length:396 start_codon:yes stop_codon:yes gene_type:complete